MFGLNYRALRWFVIGVIITCISQKVAAQTYNNPVFDRTDVPAFRVSKVEITNDTTYIYCLYEAVADSWANISKDTYLFDIKNKKKYPMLYCNGLPYSPKLRTFVNDEYCEVKLCFPTIPSITKFDLIENPDENAFNIYGIDLNMHFDMKYNNTDISRFKNKSSFYESSGDTTMTLQYKKQEIEATKYVYGIKSEPLLVSLLNASSLYNKYGEYQMAIKLKIQSGIIEAELWGKNTLYYALHLRTLAGFYSHARNFDMSIKTYKESIETFETLKNIDNEYALTLRFLADDYYEIGDSINALFCQEKCLDIRYKLGDAANYLDELYSILLQGNNVNLIKRLNIIENALNNLPDFVDSLDVKIASIEKDMATFYNILGKRKNAIEYCDKALVLLTKVNLLSSEEYAIVLSLKCKYLTDFGLANEAIEAGEIAKRLFEEKRIISAKYVELLNDLAWAYGLKYNFEESIHLQNIAANIYEKTNDYLSLSETYNSISHFYHHSEDLENAELYGKKALEILNKHDDAKEILMFEVKKTGNIRINNSFALAAIQQRINYSKAGTYQTLARTYQKQGRIIEAIETEKECGSIVKSLGDIDMYARHLVTLSEYYVENQQFSEALECSIQYIKTMGNKDPIILSTANIGLARICLKNKDFIHAIQYTKEAINELENNSSSSYLITAQFITAKSLLSYFYYKNQEYELGEERLSEVLDSIIKLVINETIGMTPEQKQRLWSIYEPHFIMYRKIISKTKKDKTQLSKLYNCILFSKTLLLDLDVNAKGNDSSYTMVDWEAIQKSLCENEIAIEFVAIKEEDRSYYTYHALIVDKTCNAPDMITLYDEEDLERIRQTDKRDFRDIGGELIWNPILNKYPHVKTIYFSPDGIFHILPIEYYNFSELGCMYERFNIYRLSSTKQLIINNQKHQIKNAILYGGIDYNEKNNITENCDKRETDLVRGIVKRGGFEPLYNTLTEIQEVDKMLLNQNIKTVIYSGEEATEESFKNQSKRVINLIHLATHGMYIESEDAAIKKEESGFDFIELLANENNPVKEDISLTHSFLVMAGGNAIIHNSSMNNSNNDGILTAKEISQIDLSKVDLVVLSACETALGDVESGGVYGLQRGFKKAGVNTILMSLNKVDDEATKILMVEFYKNLMSGKTKHQSLKDAQMYLRQVDNRKYDKPEYWASFIMLDGIN